MPACFRQIFQPLEKALDFIETNMAPMRHVELRNVALGDSERINIAEYKGRALKALKELLDERGFGVSSVSSGFAKYKRASWDDGEQWKEHQGILRRSLDVAVTLHAPYTRTFGFNRVEGSTLDDCLPAVIKSLFHY